jgi:hypothetical protein
VRTIHPVPLQDLAGLRVLTSAIQDAKRAALAGKPSRWPDRLESEFKKLEELSAGNPYAALDLKYLRDRQPVNRRFAYVVTYDNFICPSRDASGGPDGEPELVSVVKLGDGGRAEGRSAGTASGSIISRTVRSYWEEENHYNAVLQGVVIPGCDVRVSRKIAVKLGGRELQVRGDVWRGELLTRLSVDELLALMETEVRSR